MIPQSDALPDENDVKHLKQDEKFKEKYIRANEAIMTKNQHIKIRHSNLRNKYLKSNSLTDRC